MSSHSIDSATLHQDAAERLLRMGLRRIGRLVLLLVVFVLAGWASLPSSVTRPVSAATSETSQTPLPDSNGMLGFKLAVLSAFIDEDML